MNLGLILVRRTAPTIAFVEDLYLISYCFYVVSGMAFLFYNGNDIANGNWGVDHVIGYEDFEKTIYGIYGKPHRRKFEGGVDVVINFTGGDTWVPSLKATQRGGKILTCGATAGFDPKEDLRYIWTFELQILGSNSWAIEDLEQLMKMISEDKLKPKIDTVLPLEETAEGVRQLRDREVIGKIIITP